MRGLWVAELYCSSRTADKLSASHGLAYDEVRDSVVAVSGLEYVWDEDLERGLRAIVRVRIRRDTCLVVLYPAQGEDCFSLGSAYPI